jgi:DNA-binding winged helix-turn-helix (wHTH) protein
LVRRPGEVVTRDELKQAIAPDSEFGDFDHALSVAVAKLRTALNDSAERPLYIETLHKRGYRFIAPGRRIVKPR